MRILGTRIMVTADNVDTERVSDGIIIPDSFVDRNNEAYFVEVLKVGPRAKKFRVGQSVLLPRFSGHPCTDDEGRPCLITKEDDIIAIDEDAM
jgi:co-chaperonin GroES (HSP10)